MCSYRVASSLNPLTFFSVCIFSIAGFSRFMETDELAVPPRPALVHPDAVGVRIPSSLGIFSPEDPAAAFVVSPRVTRHHAPSS